MSEPDSYGKLRWYDYVICLVVVIAPIFMALFQSCRSKSKNDDLNEYFAASRHMSKIPVVLSMFASALMPNIIVGGVAEIYDYGITVFFHDLGILTAVAIGSVILVPNVYGLGYPSAFTYLEKRFKSSSIKTLTSILNICQLLMRMGVVLFAPAIAIAGVSDIPIWVSIVVCGAACILYSSVGGLKGVIWADAFQSIVMFAGLILILIMGSIKVGGMSNVWERNSRMGRFDMNFSFNPLLRYSFWLCLIPDSLSVFLMTPLNPVVVQRTISLKNVRHARVSFLWMFPIMIFFDVLLYMCGIVVFAYYDSIGCDPLKTGQIRSPNQIFTFFVTDGLRIPGFPGLLMGVLFCATMSTVSTLLNSLGAQTWKDFLAPKLSSLSDKRKTVINKILVIVYGCLAIGSGFVFSFASGNILQVTMTLLSCFIAPMFGVYALGMFFPWTEYKGGIIGVIAGFALTTTVAIGNQISDPWKEVLPTVTDECHKYQLNVTTLRNMTNSDDVFPLFTLSFYYYNFLGFYTTILIGLIISILCFKRKASEQDPRLIVPIFDRLCCFLPERFLHKARCGVNYAGLVMNSVGQYDMTGIEDEKSLKKDIPTSVMVTKEINGEIQAKEMSRF